MNYPYANGVIKALENDILSYQKLQKYLNIDQKDFFNALMDLGYGVSDSKSLEALINSEFKKVRIMLDEITPDKQLIDLFYLKNDALNIKVLYKQIKFKVDFNVFVNNGTIIKEHLEKAIYDKDYSELKKEHKELFENIEKSINDIDNPRLLSNKIDQEIYYFLSNKLKHRDEALLTYFKARIDFSNVLTMIRSISLEWDKNQFLEMLIEGGKIYKSEFITAYKADEEDIIRIFNKHYGELISRALNSYFKNGNLNNLEKHLDELMLLVIAPYSFDSFGIGPIINYFLKKEVEAQNIRLIYANNNLELNDLLKY